MDYRMEMKSRDDPLNEEQRSYELPNGEIIEVDLKKRITAAECLFSPRHCVNEAYHDQPGIA
jgi:hypothetical protein